MYSEYIMAEGEGGSENIKIKVKYGQSWKDRLS